MARLCSAGTVIAMAHMWKVLVLLVCCVDGGQEPAGSFWHITDLHWDPSYRLADSSAGAVCDSSGSRPTTHAGKFGDYMCDSPWELINSTVTSMRDILPDPDFIIWTGDDTPHVPNKDLGEEAVLRIIGNLTHILKTIFPTTKVYSALGNHDYHPKSQLPAEQNRMYEQIQTLWESWMDPESGGTFKRGGFYTEKILNQPGSRILVLNTNLYYDQNQATENIKDPADQWKWAEQQLTNAATNQEKVYIIGHVPPGFFEKKRHKPWFRAEFNKQYVELIQKHHHVIAGQFFGHHHTDSFRMFYSATGTPISTMFVAPAVTPWKSTLPGVEDGANNPGIRVIEYDRKTLQVTDMVTYYLNLTYANGARARWEKEYRLSEAFGVADASPSSMNRVLQRIAHESCYLQKYYDFNSVNYDRSACGAHCRVDHVCAMREVDFQAYELCVLKEGVSSTVPALLTVGFMVAVSMWFSY